MRSIGPGFVLAAVLAATAGACGGQSDDAVSGSKTTLTLVAYSTPREVYERLTEEFGRTPSGVGVSFDESYGPSGEQSRAVAAGLPADVVAFSLEPDVTRLVDEGLVDAGWNADEYGGMVSDSIVVFACARATRRASAPGPTSPVPASR